MVNWELRLVSKIIETGDIKTALREKMSLDLLQSTEAKQVFKYLLEQYHTHGAVPTFEMVAETFNQIKVPKGVPDNLKLVCDHVRKKYLAAAVREVSVEISEMADKDPEGAVVKISTANATLSQIARVGEDLILSKTVEEFTNEYALRKKLMAMGKTIGIPYPWPAMNTESMGMMPEEFILFYGRMKSMKTFVTSYMAAHAYYVSKKRVLFFTREMSPKQMQSRVNCSIAEVPFGPYRKGKLTDGDEKKLMTRVSELPKFDKDPNARLLNRKEPCFIIATDSRIEGGGISTIRAMIEQYDPDIVFIDGIYLMRDDQKGDRGRDWKNMANITSDIKMTAQRYGIPIVGSSQANREGNKKGQSQGMTDISFSDSMAQDADLIIKVVKDIDTTDGEPILKLLIAGSREFEMEGIIINREACTNFKEKRVIVSQKQEAEFSGDDVKAIAKRNIARQLQPEGKSLKTFGAVLPSSSIRKPEGSPTRKILHG
jgi:replicative DNA helicase